MQHISRNSLGINVINLAKKNMKILQSDRFGRSVQRRQSMVQRRQYIVHRMHGLRFRRELNLHKLLRCASGSSERFAMVKQTGTTFIPP